MAATVSAPSVSRHRLLPETSDRVLKADLRKAEIDWRKALGGVVERVQGTLSLKEFAALLGREERQVKRWITGDERPQFDLLFAVARFRSPLVIELAKLAQLEIITQICVRER